MSPAPAGCDDCPYPRRRPRDDESTAGVQRWVGAHQGSACDPILARMARRRLWPALPLMSRREKFCAAPASVLECLRSGLCAWVSEMNRNPLRRSIQPGNVAGAAEPHGKAETNRRPDGYVPNENAEGMIIVQTGDPSWLPGNARPRNTDTQTQRRVHERRASQEEACLVVTGLNGTKQRPPFSLSLSFLQMLSRGAGR